MKNTNLLKAIILLFVCLFGLPTNTIQPKKYTTALGIATATSLTGLGLGLYKVYSEQRHKGLLRSPQKNFITFIRILLKQLKNPLTRAATIKEHPAICAALATSGLLLNSTILSAIYHLVQKPTTTNIKNDEEPDIQVEIPNTQYVVQYKKNPQLEKERREVKELKAQLLAQEKKIKADAAKKAQAFQEEIEKLKLLVQQAQEQAELDKNATVAEQHETEQQKLLALAATKHQTLELEEAVARQKMALKLAKDIADIEKKELEGTTEEEKTRIQKELDATNTKLQDEQQQNKKAANQIKAHAEIAGAAERALQAIQHTLKLKENETEIMLAQLKAELAALTENLQMEVGEKDNHKKTAERLQAAIKEIEQKQNQEQEQYQANLAREREQAAADRLAHALELKLQLEQAAKQFNAERQQAMLDRAEALRLANIAAKEELEAVRRQIAQEKADTLEALHQAQLLQKKQTTEEHEAAITTLRAQLQEEYNQALKTAQDQATNYERQLDREFAALMVQLDEAKKTGAENAAQLQKLIDAQRAAHDEELSKLQKALNAAQEDAALARAEKEQEFARQVAEHNKAQQALENELQAARQNHAQEKILLSQAQTAELSAAEERFEKALAAAQNAHNRNLEEQRLAHADELKQRQELLDAAICQAQDAALARAEKEQEFARLKERHAVERDAILNELDQIAQANAADHKTMKQQAMHLEQRIQEENKARKEAEALAAGAERDLVMKKNDLTAEQERNRLLQKDAQKAKEEYEENLDLLHNLQKDLQQELVKEKDRTRATEQRLAEQKQEHEVTTSGLKQIVTQLREVVNEKETEIGKITDKKNLELSAQKGTIAQMNNQLALERRNATIRIEEVTSASIHSQRKMEERHTQEIIKLQERIHEAEEKRHASSRRVAAIRAATYSKERKYDELLEALQNTPPPARSPSTSPAANRRLYYRTP